MVTQDSLHQLQPIKAVVFPQDVQFKKPWTNPSTKKGKRQAIELFSGASKRRLLFIARNSGFHIRSQLCLTYHTAMPADGKILKKQFNNFMTQLRKKVPDVHFLWCLEFQEREAPHFHIFLDVDPKNKKFHKWAAQAWNKICGEGETHYKFQIHKRNFVPWKMQSGKYLTKQYLAKCDQKTVPENFHSVGRFWGNSRNMKPESFEVAPGEQCKESNFKKAVRIVAKHREKLLSQWISKNYRNKSRK